MTTTCKISAVQKGDHFEPNLDPLFNDIYDWTFFNNIYLHETVTIFYIKENETGRILGHATLAFYPTGAKICNYESVYEKVNWALDYFEIRSDCKGRGLAWALVGEMCAGIAAPIVFNTINDSHHFWSAMGAQYIRGEEGYYEMFFNPDGRPLEHFLSEKKRAAVAAFKLDEYSDADESDDD